MNKDNLEWALQYIEDNGFGDLVDADSIIEDAARAHLATLSEQENKS